MTEGRTSDEAVTNVPWAIVLDEHGVILACSAPAEPRSTLSIAAPPEGLHVSSIIDGIEVRRHLERDGTPPSSGHLRGLRGLIPVTISASRYQENGHTRFLLLVTPHHEVNPPLRRELDFDLLFNRNIAGIYRARLDGSIMDCNDSCARLLGAEGREAYLSSPTGSRSPFMDTAELNDLIRRLREGESVEGIETGMVRRDGTPLLVVQNMTLETTEGEEFLHASMIDVTQARLAETQAAYQEHHDALTGLPNSVLFEEKVDDALGNARRFKRNAALLLIDLDDFKNVNDTMGYNIGNQLIQLVGYRFQKVLREVDTVARLGGDEFTVILQSLNEPDDSVVVAEKLRAELARPFLIDGREIYTTAATGIAIYPEDGDTYETLMRNADIAMYRAKELGRNEIQVCSRARTLEAIERMTLENDLRRAIERDEFVLHFQPQVDSITSKTYALEALIRWNHPTRGLVMPNDFIFLAERSHLMVELGRWVLREACRTVARWKDNDPPVRVAVNVSPRQFQDSHFVDDVCESLRTSGLAPSQLELEITEGVAMQNPEASLDVLRQLKELGVRISIDDFGTGYSSLSYLTRFPIDCLKIDQGFVQGIGKEGNQGAIIAAVIALAHKLDLHVVAEGVETTEQSEFLIGQHCQSLQGFFYGRPQTAEAIDQMIRGGQSEAD